MTQHLIVNISISMIARNKIMQYSNSLNNSESNDAVDTVRFSFVVQLWLIEYSGVKNSLAPPIHLIFGKHMVAPQWFLSQAVTWAIRYILCVWYTSAVLLFKKIQPNMHFWEQYLSNILTSVILIFTPKSLKIGFVHKQKLDH